MIFCDFPVVTDYRWVAACSLWDSKFGRMITRSLSFTLMSSGLPATSTRSRLGSCHPATAQMARCAVAESVNISSTVSLPLTFPVLRFDGCHRILLLRSFLLIEFCQVLLKALNARPELQYQISFVPSVSKNSNLTLRCHGGGLSDLT